MTQSRLKESLNPDQPHFLIVVTLGFYAFYVAVCLLGNLVIPFPPLHIKTGFFFLTFLLSLIAGNYLGSKVPVKSLKTAVSDDNHAIKMLCFSFGVVFITLTASWLLMFKEFGGLSTVVNKGGEIRNAVLTGKVVVPIFLTYPNGFVFAALCIALSLLKQKIYFKWIAAVVCAVALIATNDLLSFGRVGLVFAVFCLLGFMLLRGILFRIKSAIWLLGFFLVAMLPRVLRGGFDLMTQSSYGNSFKIKIPGSLSVFLDGYVYYFASPYALDVYLLDGDQALTWGRRTFAPLFNLLSRVGITERVGLVDKFVSIPFEYNIYTVIRDLAGDFGYLGLILIPLCWGVFGGYIFKQKGIFADSLKIFYIGWLFYTPILNLLSFGGFLGSFVFLVLLWGWFELRKVFATRTAH